MNKEIHIIHTKKIIKFPKHYENLSDILATRYTIHDFKRDITNLLNDEFVIK